MLLNFDPAQAFNYCTQSGQFVTNPNIINHPWKK